MEQQKKQKLSRKARFCAWLLRKKGWTCDSGLIPEKRAIVLGVPHTSFKDFIIAYLFYTSLDGVAHVMIKKEFFFFPVGWFLRRVGCIPVDRSNSAALVKSLIEEMNKAEQFHLAIAPELPASPSNAGRRGSTSSRGRRACPFTPAIMTGAPSTSASVSASSSRTTLRPISSAYRPTMKPST